MGVMDWVAVLAAAGAAAGVLWLFWRNRTPVWAYGITLIPAVMLGHALARIGSDKLALKPWLYFMQSGGLALAFVLPALWLLGLRDRTAKAAMMRDSAAFALAYLAMGTVFWVMG